ncbi:MAG: TRAP transporter small permease subunit [Clostridiales bacterium]|nr:TRAP transporter small permease subunit [Clostridiales bacterium]
MDRATKAISIFTKALMFVCYGAMLVMLVLTISDVVARHIFNTPMTGVTEWSQMLLIICLTAMAHACVEGRYVAVGAFVERWPKKANFAIEIIMGVAAIVFFLIVGSQLLVAVETSIRFNEAYFVLNVPRWPMYMILGISFLACIPATLVHMHKRIKNYKPPSERDILDDPELAILAMANGKDGEKGGDAK